MRYQAAFANRPSILKRFFSALIDFFIVYVLFLILFLNFGDQNLDGDFEINSKYLGCLILSAILILVIPEVLFFKTLGKYAFGLRIVSIKNQEVNNPAWYQIVLRRICDPIDLFPFGLIGMAAMLLTKRNQRLGDLLAQTVVLKKKYF